MSQRRSLHQSTPKRRGLVPYRKNSSTLVPLLPYEKQLIELLGWTEEEYRYFATQVAIKGVRRPAEYDYIPDIRNETTSMTLAIISLVVGVASTTLSLVLKPDIPSVDTASEAVTPKEGTTYALDNLTGTSRFGATSGFDSVAQLADYAQPIAVIFAKREDGVGGVLAAPQLVWSRALSYGNEQGIKLLFIVGEAGKDDGLALPDLTGIFLGNTPLDALNPYKYAFYWNQNTRINGRILAKNFAYGTRGTPSAGDTQGNDDIFLVPTARGKNPDFCGAFSPSSSTSFGCYAPIPNGTGYRVNFQLQPFPHREDANVAEEDENWNVKMNRAKITGWWGFLNGSYQDTDTGTANYWMRDLGMKGTGREYSRCMGITHVNGGSNWDGAPGDHKRVVTVEVGDTCTFTIGGAVLPEEFYWVSGEGGSDEEGPVSVDDINAATIRFREAADDALQYGTEVMIGKTLWVVVERLLPVWGENVADLYETRDTQLITLECTETFGSNNYIGLVSNDMIEMPFRTDDEGQGLYEYGNQDRLGLTAGAGYYPLMLVDFGVVRNTRPCIATEIGIRSRVFNQANGLCNFPSLPTAETIKDSDWNGDTVQSGTMNTYFKRTSVFTVLVRPAGANEDGEEYDWEPLNEQFAVEGNQPTDAYNFLRFNHPEDREYEYRFLPKNGADVARHMPDEELLWLLDSRINVDMDSARVFGDYQTPYGIFRVEAVGRVVAKGNIEFNYEMATGSVVSNEGLVIGVPTAVNLNEYYPDIDEEGAAATGIERTDLLPLGATETREAALEWELFGQASSFGLSATKQITHDLGDGRTITVKYDGIVDQYFAEDNAYFPGWRAWSIVGLTVVSSSGSFNANETLELSVTPSPSNPRNPLAFTELGLVVRVTATTTTPSLGGRESAWEYEILGDAQNGEIGSGYSVQFTLSDGTKSVDIKATGFITTVSQAYQDKFGRDRAWDVTYEPVANSSTGDFSNNEVILTTRSISSGNPFFDGDEVGAYFQVQGLQDETISYGMTSDRIFEYNSGVTDLSFYEEVNKSNASASEHAITYVNEIVEQEIAPQFDRLTTAGLALRASRTLGTVDQLRVWMRYGVPVKNFHPDDNGAIQSSNLFPDLVYFLLTDEKAGVGKVFADRLIDTDSFARSCQFLRTNKIFFNGAIADVINVRSYVADLAPSMLLNSVIANGKVGLEPVVPTTESGEISQGPTPLSAIFTSGNIIENSFRLEYLSREDRRDVTINARWRREMVDKFPEEENLTIRWNEEGSEDYPMETLDLTDFCCSEAHAKLVAIFTLSARRRITHSIEFQTTPYGLSLGPGNYIRVDTQASPYQSSNNGIVESDGTIISTTPLDAEGERIYPVYYYKPGMDDVAEGDMTVVDGKTTDSEFFGTVFSLKHSQTSQGIYQVIELSLEEEGIVTIRAIEHPTNPDLVSLVALDLINQTDFVEDYS